MNEVFSLGVFSNIQSINLKMIVFSLNAFEICIHYSHVNIIYTDLIILLQVS